MRVLLSLLTASIGGVLTTFIMPEMADFILLAGPCAIASLLLVLHRLWTGRSPRKRAGPADDAPRVVVDGSNVMHWNAGVARLETLRDVLAHLDAAGVVPGVVFDANAGYRIAGKYMHDDGFAKRLGLPQSRVMVVPGGTPADPLILTVARDLGARVVSNDRFRDWAAQFPEVVRQDQLITGGYRHGRLWLDLPQPPPP